MTASVLDTGLTPGVWTIDPSHSMVGFSIRHMMIANVRGSFDDFTGQITIGDDGTASVTADIRVDSINTRNAMRDEYVLGPEYFAAQDHPVASFRSTGVRPDGDAWLLGGELTLRGVTRPVELTLTRGGVVTGMEGHPVAGFEATATVNRKDFGLTADPSLADGGAVLGSEVTLTIDVEAGPDA